MRKSLYNINIKQKLPWNPVKEVFVFDSGLEPHDIYYLYINRVILYLIV